MNLEKSGPNENVLYIFLKLLSLLYSFYFLTFV